MKLHILLFLGCSVWGFSQKPIRMDSLTLKAAKEIHIDDYNNLYIYQQNNQSLRKYDSLGKPIAQLMLTRPYNIQSVNNPLTITLFSQNTQELRLIDQNLNDIQSIDLGKTFGFAKAVYAEDLQTIWVLDDSNKSINQYQYRSQKIINTTPFFIETENIIDFLVHNNMVYILKNDRFEVYNLHGKQIAQQDVKSPIRLKRNHDYIEVIADNKVLNYNYPNAINTKSTNIDGKIVDKNRAGFLVLRENKLYLYQF